jgi:3-hydroxymyristoyl/3-hydroxydecanoyl-(acyl carrier protein) dehydratase
MRWRLLDRVTRLDDWTFARGTKAVSFEEYTLREPFGREGTLPETMVLESCVELLRWLVAHSSDFALTCALAEVSCYDMADEAGMGDCLQVETTVMDRQGSSLLAACTVTVADRLVAQGKVRVALLPMAGSFDVAWMRGRWCELYVPA